MNELLAFVKGNKEKVRFETPKGNVTIEDLWQIPLFSRSSTGISLDRIEMSINKILKESKEESFIKKKSKASGLIELKLAIVRYVITDKLNDKAKKENAATNRTRKEQLADLIADKENDSLKDLSVEDLKKMHDEL